MTAQWEQPPETTTQRAVRIARIARETGVDAAEVLTRLTMDPQRFAQGGIVDEPRMGSVNGYASLPSQITVTWDETPKPIRIFGLRPHTLVVVLYVGIALLVALVLAVLFGGA